MIYVIEDKLNRFPDPTKLESLKQVFLNHHGFRFIHLDTCKYVFDEFTRCRVEAIFIHLNFADRAFYDKIQAFCMANKDVILFIFSGEFTNSEKITDKLYHLSEEALYNNMEAFAEAHSDGKDTIDPYKAMYGYDSTYIRLTIAWREVMGYLGNKELKTLSAKEYRELKDIYQKYIDLLYVLNTSFKEKELNEFVSTKEFMSYMRELSIANLEYK